MNLFWLDTDPVLAAQAHQDIHVGKMLLEAVQLLCTAFEEPRGAKLRFPDTVNISNYVENTLLVEHDLYAREFVVPWGACTPPDRASADLLPYAHTHRNHPCAVWVRASRGNFDAAIALAQALAAEFRYRFDKPHASEAALDWVVRHRAEAQVPDGPLQPFALAMPAKYAPGNSNCADLPRLRVAAYRAYYRAEKRGYWRNKLGVLGGGRTWVPAKWTRRQPPEWF